MRERREVGFGGIGRKFVGDEAGNWNFSVIMRSWGLKGGA